MVKSHGTDISGTVLEYDASWRGKTLRIDAGEDMYGIRQVHCLPLEYSEDGDRLPKAGATAAIRVHGNYAEIKERL